MQHSSATLILVSIVTDKPYVVRYFEDETIGVISRERTRLVAERIAGEWDDWGWSTDVYYDPLNLWVEPAENYWVHHG